MYTLDCLVIELKQFSVEQMYYLWFSVDSDVIEVLNYCVLCAKYYIYMQRLYNNNKLDLFAYMSQLKYALKIESKICKSKNNEKKIAKYNFIYGNL